MHALSWRSLFLCASFSSCLFLPDFATLTCHLSRGLECCQLRTFRQVGVSVLRHSSLVRAIHRKHIWEGYLHLSVTEHRALGACELHRSTLITGFGVQPNEVWTTGRLKDAVSLQASSADLLESSQSILTAAAIHWFNDPPSAFASRWAAFLMERGSFNGQVALLMVSASLTGHPDAAQKF